MDLGPLERLGNGPWGLGDRERGRGPSGTYIAFLPEGAEHSRGGVRQALIPWSRFMLMHRVGPVSNEFGRTGPRLSATLRHPYEPWEARFTRHRRRYRQAHMHLLNELLRQTVEAGEAERLGDTDWLAGVVTRLGTQGRPWTVRALRKAVEEARAARLG